MSRPKRSTGRGFPVRDQDFFDYLESVSLIANTCKHGDGPSFERLVQKAPELFRGPHQVELSFGIPLPDDLWIDAETFSALAHAVEQFWLSMPENLPIPQPGR